MKNVPEIRFSRFTEDWEQRRLGDMCDEFQSGKSIKASDITDSGEYAVYGGNGFRGYTDTYNHDGDYALIGRQGALCGNMNFSSGKAYFTEHAVAVHGNNDNDTLFLYYLLDLMNLGQYSGQSAQPGLAVNKIIQLYTKAPKMAEQKQISIFFQQLDNLITLHQRKLDKLKQFKEAMLDKMFPKDGAKVPEIRFDGFTGDWEQRELKSITSIITKGTTPLNKSNSGTVNFIKVENIDNSSGEVSISQKISIEEHEGYLKRSQLQENDILFSIAGTLGRITSVNSDILPANTNQALAIIRLKECNLDYIKTFLKSNSVTDYIRRNPTVGAQPNLSLEQVGNLEIQLPSLREQEAIGNYFKSLDNLITLHQRKLDKLKQFKESMLNKMFV